MQIDLFKALETIKVFHSYNSWIYQNIRPFLSGTVLDIGSGIGDVAKHYLDDQKVSRVILSDGFDEMLDVLKKDFSKEPRYEILRLNISDTQGIPEQLKAIADTITCVNVLEHIEDDVQALKNAGQMLKKDGALVIMIPALPAIYGTLDSLVGHYRRYTKRSFETAAVAAGFAVKEQFFMNMPGIVTWFIAGRILRCNKFDPKPCRALDNIVPLIQRLEKCVKPPIGQSLISVCARSS